MADISLHQEEIDRFPVKQYFGLDGVDPEFNDECDYIVGWAMNKGIKTPEDMKMELKKMETRLGVPTLGENQIRRIVSYLKTDEKLTNALKEMASQERGWENMQ